MLSEHRCAGAFSHESLSIVIIRVLCCQSSYGQPKRECVNLLSMKQCRKEVVTISSITPTSVSCISYFQDGAVTLRPNTESSSQNLKYLQYHRYLIPVGGRTVHHEYGSTVFRTRITLKEEAQRILLRMGDPSMVCLAQSVSEGARRRETHLPLNFVGELEV